MPHSKRNIGDSVEIIPDTSSEVTDYTGEIVDIIGADIKIKQLTQTLRELRRVEVLVMNYIKNMDKWEIVYKIGDSVYLGVEPNAKNYVIPANLAEEYNSYPLCKKETNQLMEKIHELIKEKQAFEIA
jgi:hypothetical protein